MTIKRVQYSDGGNTTVIVVDDELTSEMGKETGIDYFPPDDPKVVVWVNAGNTIEPFE
tara:strand:- start:170 stop:343 length:174 start_codon:yes stop_codon:yes gene_type:complete